MPRSRRFFNSFYLSCHHNSSPMIRGIIFDMDGTMVDNMMVHHRAWHAQLASLGLDLSLAEVQARIHGVNTEILQRLFGDRFDAAERIRTEKEARYRQLFSQELRLVDGLPELLDELRAARIPLAIGTAAPVENVDFVLDRLQLRGYFRSVRHAGHVRRGKPDPEIFQLAAADLGLATTECLVFEDSLTGAATARNAGCPAIILTTTHAEPEFAAFSHIQRFVADYREVNLGYLREAFGLPN